jgi:hypothetical protein
LAGRTDRDESAVDQLNDANSVTSVIDRNAMLIPGLV